MSSLRVAMVVPRFAPHVGGVETHVAAIASRLLEGGVDVEVLTQETDWRLPRRELVDEVSVRRFPAAVRSETHPFSPGLALHLARRCYDVVHAHNYHGLPALMANLARRSALVFTPHYHGGGHSPLTRLLHRPYRPLGALCLARADRIICVSRAEARLVARDFPTAPAKTTVIPNGVDLAGIRAAAPFDRGRPLVLSAGRLEPHKRVEAAIRAVALVPDADFVILGTGPERPRLEELAVRLDLDGRVRFAGRVPAAELPRWLRTARAFVSMSEHEAFGLTVSEALAGGARAVVSDIPAHREIAARLPAGAVTLVPVGAPPERAAEALRAAIAPTARLGSLDLPSWDDAAARTLELYEALVAPAGRGGHGGT
jgi:glycosyltransferase involved in cell wall biosynthesis